MSTVTRQWSAAGVVCRMVALAVTLAGVFSAGGCLLAAAGAGAAGGYVVGHEQADHQNGNTSNSNQ